MPEVLEITIRFLGCSLPETRAQHAIPINCLYYRNSILRQMVSKYDMKPAMESSVLLLEPVAGNLGLPCLCTVVQC